MSGQTIGANRLGCADREATPSNVPWFATSDDRGLVYSRAREFAGDDLGDPRVRRRRLRVEPHSARRVAVGVCISWWFTGILDLDQPLPASVIALTGSPVNIIVSDAVADAGGRAFAVICDPRCTGVMPPLRWSERSSPLLTGRFG